MREEKKVESLTTEDLAYMAGFFDGEGSITIHQNYRPSPRGKSPNHTLQVGIGNIDPRVLTWIHSHFGGSFTIRRRRSPRHRIVAQWIIRCSKAALFLEAIRPFIRMKRDQVDVGIAYQHTKSMRGPKRVMAVDVAWREAQRVAIRELNAREWIN